MRTQEVFTVSGFSILGRIRKRQAVFQVKIRPRLFLCGVSQEHSLKAGVCLISDL